MAEPPERLLGHEQVLRGLWRAAAQGRLPHALLLEGPAGIGKFGAALRLVRGLLCPRATPEDGPCGSCPACKKVISGNHLDVFVLDVAHEDVPESRRQERIRIDRVVRRTSPDAWDGPVIEEFLGLRAAEGGWRAIVVREAERLAHSQNEAQNALLKMLEEPGERVLWVLETAQAEALLPTVRSRCVAVRLEPLLAADVLEVLARHGVVGAEAARLARWAQGSPGRALALGARCAPAFRARIEEVLARRCAPLAAAGAVWEEEGAFEGRTTSARQRDQARAFLDLALDVIGDLLRQACGRPAHVLPHGDVAATLGGAPHELELRRALDALLVARADLERNLDAQVLLDEALLALADVLRPEEVTT